MSFFYPVLALNSSGQIWQVVVYVGASCISREQVDIWSADTEVINIGRKNIFHQCHGDLLSECLGWNLKVVSNHSEAFHGTVWKHTAASSPHQVRNIYSGIIASWTQLVDLYLWVVSRRTALSNATECRAS